MACWSLKILSERGRDFHAGVTTRRILDLPKPVGYQSILAGLPFGMAFLTNLLILAVVLIFFAQLSNHTLAGFCGKGSLRHSLLVLSPGTAVLVPSFQRAPKRSPAVLTPWSDLPANLLLQAVRPDRGFRIPAANRHTPVVG